MRVVLAAGLLFAAWGVRADDSEGGVVKSIYVLASGEVHAVPGDSYATQCPLYTKDFPDKPERQCGVVRRKCVQKDNGDMDFEEGEASAADEPCKPIRWAGWSPHSDWFCRSGTETRCQTRACGCHDQKSCYDYFKSDGNRRRPHDFTNKQCDPSRVTSGRICHDFNEHDKVLTKTSQKRCETRPFVCHCAAEKNSMCPHCTSWKRTPAGAVADAKCGCGYKGSMSRKCVMGPDRCSCSWAQPTATCKKIKWDGWTNWDKACPQQCEPQAGRPAEKIYRERFQLCNEDLDECKAAAKLGCIGPRGHEQELCKNFKKCECVEPTKLFKDPIAGALGQRKGGAGDGATYAEPEPAQIDRQGESGAASKAAPKKGGRRSRRKLEGMRKGKGASIFNNLLEGVQNIFKGRKTRRRRKNADRRKRGRKGAQ